MKNFIIFLIISIILNLSGARAGFAEILDDSSGEENTWLLESAPEFYIKAVNPGYTTKNVGEMIEIGRKDLSEEMVSLAGINFSYKNKDNTPFALAEMPKNSFLSSETLLLKLASSPDSELANLLYKKTLAATAGTVEIIRDGEVIDSVCWGMSGCYKKFDSDSKTTLVRNLKTGDFEHVSDYEPEYFEDGYIEVLEEEPRTDDGPGSGSGDSGAGAGGSGSSGSSEDEEGYGGAGSRCKGVVFSELLSYYAEEKSEQFVEFFNSGTETVAMDGCRVRYKKKEYALSGMIKAEGYLAVYFNDLGVNVTKNPTNSNILELLDADGTILDTLEYFNGQRKGTAWAFIGYDKEGEEIWKTTYAVTPGEPNIYQEYKSCEEGKVINEETGNCVKVTEVTEKTCAEGQYLNPLTGRCKKIEEETEKVCDEGWELNLETGRCWKIKTNDGANYEIEPETYEEKSSFIGLIAVSVVAIIAVSYIIWEFRREILRILRKVFGRFRR